MTAFWFVAALLCAAAVAFLLWPLWRQRTRSGRWSIAGLATAAAIVPVAAGMYLAITTWNPQAASQADEGMRLVRLMAERMRQTPDDVEGWRLLARSYMSLGQYELGRAAYLEAWRRTPSPDNELKTSLAEALVLSDRAMLAADAGQLFEEVLDSDPEDIKALWYGGLAAQAVGDEELWRTRWTKLLALGPPPELERALRAQLGTVDAEGAGAQAPAAGPSVRLKLGLGEGPAAVELGPNAALFIIARAPGGGSPIAVRREPPAGLPGEFVLSDANAMLGRSLGDYEELTVVARLSPSGQTAEQPGDWYAQATFRPRDSAVVELTIDRLVQ